MADAIERAGTMPFPETPNTPTTLNEGQLELLKVMSRPMSDDDLRAIKQLIVRYFADKLSDRADSWWDANGMTEADETRLLHTHFRTNHRAE